MTKLPIVIIMLLTLIVLGALPASSEAATFYANETGKCYEVVQKNVINQYWVIYVCESCNCLTKKEMVRKFTSIEEAMDYLEREYGTIEPR